MDQLLLTLLQQNWEDFKNNNIEFLKQANKKQLLHLLEMYKKQVEEESDNVVFCYYCFEEYYQNSFNGKGICDDCIKKKNLINIHCGAVKEIDLKTHVIAQNNKGNFTCLRVKYTFSCNSFDKRFINQEWYHHCFGKNMPFTNRNNHKCTILFNLENDLHYKFFTQCTRFNHFTNYDDIRGINKCNMRKQEFYYNSTETESSVEKIMAIIDTLRLVFIEFRVPKCLRNLLIEWFLI